MTAASTDDDTGFHHYLLVRPRYKRPVIKDQGNTYITGYLLLNQNSDSILFFADEIIDIIVSAAYTFYLVNWQAYLAIKDDKEPILKTSKNG